jgi:lipoate-protein ligase B
LRVHRLGKVGYAEALRRQEELVEAKLGGDDGDDLLLLEHESVYTLGRGADEADLMGVPERLRIPVFRIGRGGGATFHGPGQMVAYPIVHLRHGRDVHRYVRGLERALIRTCAAFGVTAGVVDGQTGVWTNRGKIAAIGIGVRRGVTFHGVALNVSTDVDCFRRIVACRGEGSIVANLNDLSAAPLSVAVVADVFANGFAEEMELTEVEAGPT